MSGVPTLDQFAGRWQLDRTITDHRGGSTGRFVGVGCFTPDGDGLAYVEQGTIQFDGQPPLHAERAYRWRSAGRLIEVAFADDRPFHSFDPTSPEATHWCDPDRYAVRYEFEDWPSWCTTWDVSGPRKAYRMITRFEKIQDG